MLVSDACNALLAATLSPPCAACGKVLDHPLASAVCTRCWESIALPRPCFALGTITAAVALGEYDGTLRDIIHAIKYEGRRSIARRLSSMMATAGHALLSDADFVVPVPLHRSRQRERGFNQAADLAAGLGVPVLHALRRTRSTRAQVALHADERHANVREAFAVRTSVRVGAPFTVRWWTRRELAGTVLVLVDDVATTGATLDACARALRAVGVSEVRALTAARAVSARR